MAPAKEMYIKMRLSSPWLAVIAGRQTTYIVV